ncbi:15584_t:CDS:2, partial [Entrophospora sp. SA101]
NQCSVYAMDLKYDGIYYYILILLDKFFLLRNCYDLGVIPASIEALTVVKYIVIKSANIILNNLRNPTNGISISAARRNP